MKYLISLLGKIKSIMNSIENDNSSTLELFNNASPEKQWEFVHDNREHGELIIDDNPRFIFNENGEEITLKLKDISIKFLLETLGFDFKIINK